MHLYAQNTFPASGSAGIGTVSPNASSALDITSTTQGMLVPRMTTAQRNAIAAPATGLLIYETDGAAGFYYYTGATWTGVRGGLATSTLANLMAPTKVNVTVQPGVDNSVDLGATGFTWRNLYVTGVGYLGTAQVGNYAGTPQAGMIRWTGLDFQGYNGAVWQSLTTGTTYTAGAGIDITGNVITNTAIGWSLTGNSGTTVGTNFLGTTDAQALMFKVNKTKAGYVDYDSTKANTSLGYEALNVNTANGNSAFGNQALVSNISGYSNVAVGINALYKNTAGHNLVAVGDSALFNQNGGSGDTKITDNTAIGSKALYSNVSGADNTASGFRALYSNKSGSQNTANGSYALYLNMSNQNTASGFKSLYFNSTGIGNTATGATTLYSNTTGSYNTSNGLRAMYFNTTGANNTANGSYALYNNKTGYSNVAIGTSAMYLNDSAGNCVAVGDSALYSQNAAGTGNQNTALGSKAMFSNTGGYQDVAVGYHALYLNTAAGNNTAIGYSAMGLTTIGDFNTATGSGALGGNSTGYFNTAYGYVSMGTNTTGTYNAAYGAHSLYINSSGERNVGMGNYALYSNSTGNYNTALGFYANVSANNFNNTTVIGSNAVGTASNQVRIGDNTVTSIGGYTAWTNLSDGRFKKNIKENVPGLAFIKKLRPVTYNLDIKGINNYLKQSMATSKGDQQATAAKADPSLAQQQDEAIAAREKIVSTGFVAQEVEKTAKDMGYDFDGVDAPKNSNDFYGLRYSEFVVPLVKAVQELSSQNDSLKTDNSALKSTLTDVLSQLSDLRSQLNELKTAQEACCFNANQSALVNPQSITAGDAAKLEQNAPNPFNNNTIIRYYIPSTTQNAQMIVTSVSGQVLKYYSLSSKGAGQTTIYGGELASGNYFYTLVVDGKKIATKQMVLLQ